MTKSGRGMLMIWTNVPSEAEADFNRWYDREHVAERVAMPGFMFGRRYRTAIDAPLRYLALYGTVTCRHGAGHGGKIMAGLLTVPQDEADETRAILEAGLLKPAAALDGVTSAWLLEADSALSRPVTPGAPIPDPNGPLTWLVAIEAGTMDAFPAVRVGSGAALAKFKLSLIDLELLWSLERSEMS